MFYSEKEPTNQVIYWNQHSQNLIFEKNTTARTKIGSAVIRTDQTLKTARTVCIGEPNRLTASTADW